MRTLTSVLTLCALALPLTAAPGNEPARKAAVREIDLTGLQQQSPDHGKPVVISSMRDLQSRLDVCPKAPDWRLLERQTKDVDFQKEKLVLFTWTGPGQDRLTFRVESCPKHRDHLTGVTFQYERGGAGGGRVHVRLMVLPKSATWSVAGENYMVE